MFYFLFIFRPIDKLFFLAVVLCKQLKWQAFQAVQKSKREPSGDTLLDQSLSFWQHLAKWKTDQTRFAEHITIHGKLQKEDLLLQLLFPIEIPY